MKCYVGGAVDLHVLAQARETFFKAEGHRHPADDGQKRVFEVLEDEHNVCKVVIDSWFDNRENIVRIGAGRTIERKAHAAVRLRPLPSRIFFKNGIRGEDGVVVFIPLQDWDSGNGCFLGDLIVRVGEYVCIQGKEPVNFPSSSGGATLIWMFLEVGSPESDEAP